MTDHDSDSSSFFEQTLSERAINGSLLSEEEVVSVRQFDPRHIFMTRAVFCRYYGPLFLRLLRRRRLTSAEFTRMKTRWVALSGKTMTSMRASIYDQRATDNRRKMREARRAV